uniref:Uncharacterized protein n=2 Tax=Opuntia streptacantha TaxID=393608 RepID=A0A7C8YH44_OPUST
MDVLFKSIDVRDLLSAPDLDDTSSPLSAPDLRLLIDRLDNHSQHIKSKVQEYIVSHQSHFSELLSLSSTSVSQSLSLSSQLDSLLSLLSNDGHPIDVEINSILKEIKTTVSNLESKKSQACVLRVIVKLSKNLSKVRELMQNGGLVEAVKLMLDLKRALRIDDKEEREKEVVVYELLRGQWFICFEEIQDLLVKLMENAVRFEHELSQIRVVFSSSVGGAHEIQLHTVLEAMDMLGILDYGVARTADLFMKFAIGPATNLRAPVSFVEESFGSFVENGQAILKIIPSSDAKMEDVDGKALFLRLTTVVKFIYRHICLQSGRWMRCFGKLTWPRMSELIISNFLSKVVPDDASKLADFHTVMNTSSEFEIVLKEVMFISESDKNDQRLSNFADNVEVHFAVRKKAEILAKARQLILQFDFTIPLDFDSKEPNSGSDRKSHQFVDLLFSSESCMVSEAALQLMQLVHQTLRDICVSSPRVALQFYHAARDALQLYEAIIPIKLERQLDSVNQVAVLMHNDCLYLSQEILGLAFEYRPNLPSFMKEHAVFVDMAPRLQLVAEEILQKHIRVIASSLKEAVDGADGFQNTHQMPQYESAKFSLEQVVFILEKVRLIWEPVLLPSTYKRSMCVVLESVFSRITQDILLLDDIAAEETLQLQKLIHLLLESLVPLLESLSIIQVDKKSDQCFSRPLEADIPSLGKIRKLADLLDMSLKSVTEAWENGDLYGCGFVLTEVVDFIKAIFTDSPLRRDCLGRIRRINF